MKTLISNQDLVLLTKDEPLCGFKASANPDGTVVFTNEKQGLTVWSTPDWDSDNSIPLEFEAILTEEEDADCGPLGYINYHTCKNKAEALLLITGALKFHFNELLKTYSK